MTTPVSNSDETSRMKRIENASVNDSIKARLPQGRVGTQPPPLPPPPPPAVVASAPPSMQEGDVPPFRNRLLAAFWTVASVLSLGVNVVLIALFLIVLNMLVGLQVTVNDQVSGLLGGLYNNFVLMDQATISTNIRVQNEIPLDFTVPVDLAALGPTTIVLPKGSVLNAYVEMKGDVIVRGPATVTLLQDTTIPDVRINASFQIPIQRTVPIDLNVPVNIPLNQTQLHQPFTGLRQVVEPYYCLVEPNAIMNGQMVCTPKNPQ